MNESHPAPLLCQRAVRWLSAQIRENAIPLAASLISGLLAYGFFFANKLVNHDEAFCLFSKGATVDSGRWGLGAMDLIFPNISVPWLYGLLTIALLAVSVCLIIHIFRIESRLFQALLAGSILVFPSLTGTFGYMFTASSFAVSFLLAVLAVWFLEKQKLYWGIPAVICMVASLSIYQSYISLAAGLLVVSLIARLLREEDVGKVFLRGVYELAFLIISLGLYYAATQIVLVLKDVSFNDYASGNISFRLSAIPAGIAEAYRSFFAFFTKGQAGLMPTVLSRWANGIAIAAGLGMLVIWATQNRQPGRIALLAALAVILPLAVNCMYIFTTPESIHTLVLYGFVSVYVLIILAADTCLRLPGFGKIGGRLALDIAAAATVLVIAGNIFIANAAGLQLYLRQENTTAFFTALVSDLQRTPGFDEHTRLALLGDYQRPEYLSNFDFLNKVTGVTGISPNNYSREKYIEYYLGFQIPFATNEETEALKATTECAEMPVYPYYGSIKKIGDILVVKLS